MVRYFNLAYTLALDIDRKFKHISIITDGKTILSTGSNQLKTHPKCLELGYAYDQLHSELHAFSKLTYAQKRLKLYLYNYRFNPNMVIGNSRPCKYCLPWCYEIFQTRIWYTDTNKQLVRINERAI